MQKEGVIEMAKFRKKPVVIEAMTLDELVQYGIDNGGNVVDALPWSFKIGDRPVTHDCQEWRGPLSDFYARRYHGDDS